MGITKLPSSLSEALDALEKSSFVKEVLGKELVSIFIKIKREECKEYEEVKKLGETEEWEWEYKKFLERV